MANLPISELPVASSLNGGELFVVVQDSTTKQATLEVLETALPSGTSGTSGTSGLSGSSGTSGTSGTSGSSGTSGISPVTGSWEVTPGTDNYSFTVDQNNSYTMWVRGNIPNGIIIWNATVSVSNANVPVIGVQYAWNYTGGGSPLLLASIPSQIIGTSGSILTDNIPVSSANTFTFSIINDTEVNQTVYYGYLTL
jgi:hypothetical protein